MGCAKIISYNFEKAPDLGRLYFSIIDLATIATINWSGSKSDIYCLHCSRQGSQEKGSKTQYLTGEC
jgi:hypothetical protein